MDKYSILYTNSLKRKYNQITNEIILENIKSIEEKISEMKISFEILEKNVNAVDNKYEKQIFSQPTLINTNNHQKFSHIFDSSKFSLKKIQENIDNLTKEEKSDLNIHIEHSYFYLNINIDKSFEIFIEEIRNKKIEDNLNYLIKEYCQRFISRILELDRLIYVRFYYNLINFFNLKASLIAKFCKN
jgi:hypothetical protein